MQQILDTKVGFTQSQVSFSDKFYQFPPIHIVIPAYNESKAILDVIDRIHCTLLHSPCEYRITVIDDGSSDSTFELLQKSTSKISLMRNWKNLGKGKTIRRGIVKTYNYEILVMIDGDGEHLPENIPKLIEPILAGDVDYVIGSRFIALDKMYSKSGSYLKNQKKYRFIRKMGNFFISFLIFVFYTRWITDSQCGFRAFAPGIASCYKPTYSGFEIETEMTLFFIMNNSRIREIPIDTGLNSRESHMHVFKDTLKIVSVILSMRFKLFNRIFQKLKFFLKE